MLRWSFIAIIFQSARSSDQAAVGDGIFLLKGR
jgi:hypothetical protein